MVQYSGGDLGSLIVKIGADTRGLVEGLRESDKNVKSFAASADKSTQAIAAGFVVMGVAITAALIKATNEAVKFGSELYRLQQISGIAAGEIAKLGYAFQQEGVSAGALARTFPVLARNIEAATEKNSEAAQAFKTLGVNVRDADGNLRDVQSVFMDVAQGVKESKNQTEALASVMRVLGRGGGELIPVLKLGADGIKAMGKEFESFGISSARLTSFAATADKYGDTWDKIKSKFQLAGIAMAEQLLPAFQEFATLILSIDWIGIGTAIGALAKPFVLLALGIADAVAGLTRLIAMAPPWMTAGFTGMPVSMPGGGLQAGAPGTPGAQAMMPGGGGIPGALVPGGAAAFGPSQGIGPAVEDTSAKLEDFQKTFEEMSTKMQEVFTTAVTGMFDTFGESFAGMLVQGKDFSDSMAEGFKSLAQQFIAAIVSMIVKWAAFITAVMAIALILQAFGVPIGETFKAAFNLLKAGASQGGVLGNLGGSAKKRVFGLFDEGAFLAARNGLLRADSGLMRTGSLGLGGIPAVVHPNEIITPIDKFYDFLDRNRTDTWNITINGYNRDPRELAQAIQYEADRKRRAP